ncbi:prepilin peptidase [bacterium]|nr:prepilin peptidase [bacterium]
MYSVSTEIIPIVFLMVVLFIAVITDLRRHRIPNLLTLTAAAAGICYHTVVNGWDGFLFSVGGMLLGAALLIVFYILSGMGAGDVKLMGAVGSLLGPKGVFAAFIFTAIAGGIYAIALMIFSGMLSDAAKRYWMMLKTYILTGMINYINPDKGRKKPVLCYGVAIAAGTMISVLRTLI